MTSMFSYSVLIALGVLLTKSLANAGDEKRTYTGGWSVMDPSSDKVIELSQFGLNEIDARSNALYKQKISKILSAKQQVVAGMKYKLLVNMSYTTCKKNDKNIDDECHEDPKKDTNICEIVIWEKLWINFREMLNFSCNLAKEEHVMQKRTVNSVSYTDSNEKLWLFKGFIQKYNKLYKNEEEMQHRYKIFQDNLKYIEALTNTEQGTAEYGITEFTDLSKDEFKQRFLGLNPALAKAEPQGRSKIPNVLIPPSFDWRDHNVVTPVKNQEQCGSCWAFSVTGNVEGQWAIKKGNLLSLSEQELVDCDKMDQGCEGGYMTNAYDQIIKLGGLESESDYPYEAEDEKCHFQKPKVKATINSYVNISQNETEMAQWLYKNGPISIGINANAMQFYFGGISHPWKFLCSPKNLDHGVLIVGYGTSKYPLFNKTIPYWVVKNSWGTSWGEKGYYRVFRGDGTCGLNLMATSSVVD